MTPCPSCASQLTRVVSVTTTADGDRLRRRYCRLCDHRWYSLQPPERVIDPAAIIWPNGWQGGDRPPVRIVPTEEEFNATA